MLDLFYKNITFDKKEQRYSITWPWRSYPPPVPNNYDLAVGVLRWIVKKSSPHQLKIINNEIFNEQLNSGIIERVPDVVPRNGTHYLPYHFVIKEGKSTPLRIVYNGSTKRKKTNNLSERLHVQGCKSVPQYSSICVLLRFRLYRVATIADGLLYSVPQLLQWTLWGEFTNNHKYLI